MRRTLIVVIVACMLAGCIGSSEPPPVPEPIQSSGPPPTTQPPQQMEESEEPGEPGEPGTEEPEGSEESEESRETLEEPEETPTEYTWKIATPEEQGLNSDTISDICEYIERNGRIDSFLIVKNGYLVVEEYYNGYDKDSYHNTYSCTKSFTSALIGIAIDNKHIKSVDEKVLDFFPEYEFRYVDERKKEITIEHLLTMTSGLKFGELSIPYSDMDNPFYHMIESEDWVKFVLDKPVIREPGTTFDYSTGSSHVLSAILQKATGMDTLSYAVKYLFTPLGIEEDDLFWETDPQGIYFGGSWLHMKPRDMAKFGMLYLNNGTWNGNQIISKEWVIQSTKSLVYVEDYADYGYQWWVESSMYFAEGYNGQFIYVLKDFDMVVVFTAEVSESDVFHDLIARIRAAGINLD